MVKGREKNFNLSTLKLNYIFNGSTFYLVILKCFLEFSGQDIFNNMFKPIASMQCAECMLPEVTKYLFNTASWVDLSILKGYGLQIFQPRDQI